MNPQAAQEILDIIMLEDFVQRRQALDTWSRRWIATLHVEGRVNATPPDDPAGRQIWAGLRDQLVREILQGLLRNEVHAMNWGRLLGEDGKQDDLSLACQMHVVLQVPRDIDAGSKAAQAMMDMAKGGSHE